MLINIPFIKQTGSTKCVAACLEMVYRTCGINRNQDIIFKERSTIRDQNRNEKIIKTEHAVYDAERWFQKFGQSVKLLFMTRGVSLI